MQGEREKEKNTFEMQRPNYFTDRDREKEKERRRRERQGQINF